MTDSSSRISPQMPAADDTRWLAEQIEDDRKLIAEWPEWLRRAAYMEGEK